ncbi:MAG: PAS domain S-box protein [Balneolaceae bacterium]|nr:PAS domain S-box protein [Balneolaceae bacterium]MBO6546535.1 PAS domain S-box protein [Balneolaceae bacterium]MBO6648894.1 PAS domain S-box protein [Balneolaceae bacterium]
MQVDGTNIISSFDLTPENLIILGLVIVITFFATYLIFLRRANKKMNSFLLNSLVHEQDQYIVFFDFESKIIFANKKFEDLIGLPARKYRGKKLNDLPVEQSLKDAFLKHNDDISERRSSSIVYKNTFLRDGKEEWFQFQKRTLSLQKSDVTYILTEASDVSDKKMVEDRLSDTQSEYKQLVESANDIIFKTDLKGNFNFVNSIVKETLGYSEPEFLSLNFRDLVIEEDYPKVVEFYEDQLKRKKSNTYLEFRVKTKSGEEKWLGQSVSFIKYNEEIKGFQSVTRDITSAKETEDHLKRAKEIAEATSKTKTGFIASMSHEFRTPLNAILGYTQILGQSDALKGIEKEHIKTISSAGEQLLGMVTDILELSTLESDRSKLDEELVALAPFMKELSDKFAKKAKSQALNFHFKVDGDAPDIIEVDLDKITSIIKNLLTNAIKFTKEGTVGLSYGVQKKGDQYFLQIEVKDTGIGISKETLEQVFEPFWQLDSMKNDGTGLGLTLCQRLVEFLGGEISIKSKMGKGTIVSVSVPVQISEQKTSIVKEGLEIDSINVDSTKEGRIKVLIVDDLEPNRTITRLILKENGFEFKEVENGQEALDVLENFNPDCILMDINMPVMDGLEAMLTIRASGGRFADIPIIAVTAGGFKGDRNELMEQGFSEYILKPFKTDHLISTINNFVGKVETTESSSEKTTANSSNQSGPESVALFIASMDDHCREKIVSTLEMQDLDSISKLPDVEECAQYKANPDFDFLVNAAKDYDYLFVTKVVKLLQDSDKIKA